MSSSMREFSLSFEVMPPRNPDAAPNFWNSVEQLVKLRPDFLSITYGALGKDRDTALRTVSRIVQDTPVLPVAHLTCKDTQRENVESVVDDFLAKGVRMFLALRGDACAPEGTDTLSSAAELTYLLRSQDKRRQRLNPREKFKVIARPLVICVAAFPNGNPELGTTQDQEIERLLEKQDAGADFAITQLYYDVNVFDEFMAKCRKRGVTLPIIAGIGPTWRLDRLEKIERNIKIAASPSLVADLEHAENEEKQKEIGLQFFENIAVNALNSGAVGLHFFTFNQPTCTLALVERLKAKSVVV